MASSASLCSLDLYRFGGVLAFVPLRFESKVNHHDGVLLDDADEHDDADEAIQIQAHIQQRRNPALRRGLMEQVESQQSAETRRGQTRENRDRVNETFVQNS